MNQIRVSHDIQIRETEALTRGSCSRIENKQVF